MTVLAAAYAAIARARRRSYERRPDRRRRLRRPVISIGNIAVGGSGKTPAVAHVAKLLVAAGERPAILTRGYHRRQPTEGALVVGDGRDILADLARAGDEPLMLARALPGVVVIVGADRYVSGVLAERRFGCSLHLLDDGFQHVQLHRDVDIVLLAPEDLHGRVLPDGRLREALTALRHADAIVVNTNGEVDAQAVSEKSGVATVFRATTRLAGSGIREASGMSARSGTSARSDPVVAVAGIARPARFFEMLRTSGWNIVREMAFSDHHWFSRADLDRMVRAARDAGATRIVTTAKDEVRLLPFRPFPMPVVAVPLELTIEAVPGQHAMPVQSGEGAAARPSAPFADWLMTRLAAARSALVEQSA